MKKYFDWLTQEESGQGMVEYGLIIAFVALVAVVGVTFLGTQLRTFFNDVGNNLPAVP